MSYPRDDARPALRDLADAPASLRNLSEACRTGDVNLWPDDQADDERITHADVHRWADALDDILKRAEGFEPWKVWLMAGVVFLVGVLAGAVAVMVAL